MTINAIILARVSTSKQATEGDTLDEQMSVCTRVVEQNNWHLLETFLLVESGRIAERKYFESVIQYCKNKTNNVQYVVIKNISRFSRQGDTGYLYWKSELSQCGVQLKDVTGVIGPENNALEHLGFQYEWSIRHPTQAAEVYEANKARDTASDGLIQMIGAEIQYTQKGYWNKPAPYGYLSQKIETQEDGKRNILIPNEKEATFVREIYSLRADGVLSDSEIVKQLNARGYCSRKRAIRDKLSRKIIGYGGEKKLSVKKLQELVKRPVYAGYLREKWTYYQLVRAKFKGLIELGTYNKANRSKVYIDTSTEPPKMFFNNRRTANAPYIKRLRNNPDYPYKRIFLCPICKQYPTASASQGKSKIHYPAYHCTKGRHRSWRVSKVDVHKTIEQFISKLEFNPAVTKLFTASYLEVWEEKRTQSIQESKLAANNVQELLTKQQQTLETIKFASSNIVRQSLENEYESLEKQIIEARATRNSDEHKEDNVKRTLKFASYLMEHPGELLINQSNMHLQQSLFGLVFEEPPTYTELVNGTPKLTPIFKLKQSPALTKSDLVTPSGFEPELAG